ncbi:MAG TPA: SET domain-containing protein [Oleiagrimonas sp.]|nr:SET domain-containing protein [Oleiagrimonas sp.]
MRKPATIRPARLADARLEFIVDNMPDASIGASAVHGHGLFASRRIESGAVIGLLDGQLVDWSSYDVMEQANPFGDHGADLFMEWNALSTDTLLVRPFRTKYSFINHDREPNACLAHEPLRVIAARAIAVDEEITLDYRQEPLRNEYLAKADWL